MPASTPDNHNAGFGIYVHWPFCKSICPYCDFNVHKARFVNQEHWRRALLQEIDHTAMLMEARRCVVQSVFFGGGTPSLMAPQTVAAIVDRITRLWPMAADVEISLEANPDGINAAHLKDFRTAGVNRISLGVQALDKAALRFLGRRHTVDQALEAMRLSRGLFDRVSIDLIYGRPGQDVAGWAAELNRALAEEPDHLSLYMLTIEPGTPFARARDRGRLVTPDEDRSADLFEATREICADAGWPAYEVSSHGRREAWCRHNLVYWRCGEYAGVGPGAHGRIYCGEQRVATRTRRSPADWLANVDSKGHGLDVMEPLNSETCAEELVMMGLRLAEGISLTRYTRLAGKPLEASLVDRLVNEGALWRQHDRLGATSRGFVVLDEIIADLLKGAEHLPG